MDISIVFAGIGAMLLVGAFSNKLSSRFNVPILLIFLLFGMFIGQNHVPGDLEFAQISLAGTVAMCFILFSGGLDTRYKSIKQVLIPGGALATIGVILTSLFFAFCAWGIFRGQFSFASCMLLGAMISSTDAAAVLIIVPKLPGS